jgi:hypothetical protein
MSKEENWEEWWGGLIQGMEQFFGACDDNALPAAIPFSVGQDLGGCPDVVSFSKYIEGTLYVTMDLTDSEQLSNEDGNYELAIAHEGEEQWGVDFICHLAFSTLTKTINDGDTMDMSLDMPEDSTLDGFLFKRIAKFDVLGHPCSVLCCIGITESELKFCQENGSDKLIEKLGGDYIVTDLYRESFI